MNTKHAIFSLLTPLIFFPPIFANAGEWEIAESKNVISVSGVCENDSSVPIELFSGKSDEASYTSGASCENGQFFFSDDLLKWNLPDGTYRLAIANDRTSMRDVFVSRSDSDAFEENIPQKEPEGDASAAEELPQQTLEEAQKNFGDGVMGLQESLAGMRVGLASSAYADTSKTKMGIALDLLESAISAIQSLFFEIETQDVSGIDESIESAAVVDEIPTASPDSGNILNQTENPDAESVSDVDSLGEDK